MPDNPSPWKCPNCGNTTDFDTIFRIDDNDQLQDADRICCRQCGYSNIVVAFVC